MTHDRLLDLRHEQTEANRRAACEYRRGAVLMRDPRAITGVTLHQTGCWYGVSPGQARASLGDIELARHRRALKIHAPITAMRHGRFVVTHDPLAHVNAAHQLNPFTVSIEHEGHYRATGEAIDMPGGVDVGVIIEAGRAALDWALEQVPTITTVYAHRQAMRTRAAKAADPGARIFLEVGVQHGVKRRGLRIDPTWHAGTGLPLLSSWYR